MRESSINTTSIAISGCAARVLVLYVLASGGVRERRALASRGKPAFTHPLRHGLTPFTPCRPAIASGIDMADTRTMPILRAFPRSVLRSRHGHGHTARARATHTVAYSASAPTLMYAQQIDQYAYYKVIASSMEKSVAGCVGAARVAFAAVASALRTPGSKASVVEKLGICTPLPSSDIPRERGRGAVPGRADDADDVQLG